MSETMMAHINSGLSHRTTEVVRHALADSTQRALSAAYTVLYDILYTFMYVSIAIFYPEPHVSTQTELIRVATT